MSRQLFIQHIKTQRKDDPFRFYVYAYLRSKDSIYGKKGTPYYIGKGCGKRAWTKHHGSLNIPPNISNIIIMEINLSNIGAFALERRYIEWYGRQNNDTGILKNLTDGGEGRTGSLCIPMTSETKLKIGVSNSGCNNGMFGKTHSEEQKLQWSVDRAGTCNSQYGLRGELSPNFGRILSEDQKIKFQGENNGMFGKTHTDKSREEQRKAKQQYFWVTPTGSYNRVEDAELYEPVEYGGNVRRRCNSQNEIIKMCRSGVIKVDWVGKTWKDVGYYKIPI